MTTEFQPLHQKNENELNSASSSLYKSMFKKPSPQQVSQMKNKFASPTDELLSPCSQKLNAHRSKLFEVRSNPTKLNFQSQEEKEDEF